MKFITQIHVKLDLDTIVRKRANKSKSKTVNVLQVKLSKIGKVTDLINWLIGTGEVN